MVFTFNNCVIIHTSVGLIIRFVFDNMVLSHVSQNVFSGLCPDFSGSRQLYRHGVLEKFELIILSV